MKKPTERDLVLDAEERFRAFLEELSVLSLKHGILPEGIRRFRMLSDSDLRCVSEVRYFRDPVSGELQFEPYFKV